MFKDPILKKLYKTHGPHEFEDRGKILMTELIESIISQQLSVKAADTIYSRFLKLFKNGKFTSADEILKIDVEKLRSAGMSYSKAKYIKNIAKAFKDGEVVIEKIQKMTDEEVIVELTKIKGIGKWTAEMTLIFTLKREDVFSPGDAGLKRAIKNLYGITNEKEILKLSETWKPKRSYACWYLWRSLNNVPKT
jgi:DNA-3-methyladenine glycosylase II